MKRLGMVGLVACVLLGLSGPRAEAGGTATVEGRDSYCPPGETCIVQAYTAGTAQANYISAVRTPEKLTITDPGVLMTSVSRNPSALCYATVGRAECANADQFEANSGSGSDRISVTDIDALVFAGTGNDKVDISGPGVGYAFVAGSGGKDTIDVRGPNLTHASLDGGDGHDWIYLRGPSLEFLGIGGGSGNDTITLNVPTTAEIVVHCGSGYDRLYGVPAGAVINGGDGTDDCEVIA